MEIAKFTYKFKLCKVFVANISRRRKISCSHFRHIRDESEIQFQSQSLNLTRPEMWHKTRRYLLKNSFCTKQEMGLKFIEFIDWRLEKKETFHSLEFRKTFQFCDDFSNLKNICLRFSTFQSPFDVCFCCSLPYIKSIIYKFILKTQIGKK